ncbi:MAG: NUDIX domain-containing protein [Tissierellia bacterium]|nr:NUDIX domain-containing protein [Tissierellia bacterium]
MKVKNEWNLPPLFSQDKPFIKEYHRQMKNCTDPFGRKDTIHFCGTAMILNREKTHVLMIYHKIYDSWSFPGGHADGEEDLLLVGKKEAKEETGISVEPVFDLAISWDILKVKSHVKHGKIVESHNHLDGTYLYFGDQKEELEVNLEETKGVKWIPIKDWEKYVTEDHMMNYYRKVFRRAFTLLGKR